MPEQNKVKISQLIESQIPSFLNQESPLFTEFLEQYYISQEHQSGVTDLAVNLPEYRQISSFNNETLIPYNILLSNIFSADDTITVQSTAGWPDQYGLIKIDNEIITYKSKTATQFLECSRGFSGITKIQQDVNSEFLDFSISEADEHSAGSLVYNLSNLFLQEFFSKFKKEFLPGFENRSFITGTSVQNILTRAKDFYSAKGTDASYQILFKLLYGEEIAIVKPIGDTIISSANVYFKTKNILVENLFDGDPLQTVGNFLFQNVTGIGTVSASIYNVEYRPIDNKDFYEISLDASSFSGSYQVPGKTKTLQGISQFSDNILVDSTIGFDRQGSLLIKPTVDSNFIEIQYTDKTVNQFLGVSGITTDLVFGAEIFEDKLAFSYAGFGQTSQVQLRIVNVIDTIDVSDTANMVVGDSLKLSTFGLDKGEDSQFNSWIYNIPTIHNIDSVDQLNINTFRINLFDDVVFYIGEKIVLSNGNTEITGEIRNIEYDSSRSEKRLSNKVVVVVNGSLPIDPTVLKKTIVKAQHNLGRFPEITKFPVGIQNSYLSNNGEDYFVTTAGIPNYPLFATDNRKFVRTDTNETVDANGTPINGGGFTYLLKSVDVDDTNTVIRHNYTTGDKIFWDNTFNSGIQTGIYFITAVNETELYLSFSGSDVFSKKYIPLKTNSAGQYIVKSGFENKNLEHQKILRKFPYVRKEQYFDDPNTRDVKNRAVGLLANGVEIYPPTVFDEQIYYGDVVNIKVTSSGKDYDVINGPDLVVQDQNGSGCKAFPTVTGSFREVRLVSPGIGYQEKPKITVEGGNGDGAVLESNFVKGKIIVNFKADGTSVNSNSETIDFPSVHNFELGEEVFYDAKGNTPIGNLISGATYFIRVIDDKTIALHTSFQDAVNNANTVNIGAPSFGFHSFVSTRAKNTITKIYVKEPGSGYSNRKVIVPSQTTAAGTRAGIDTSDNYIYARGHNFTTRDVVRYSHTGNAIGGLSSTTEYFVRSLDSNRFKLYDVGIGTTRDLTNFEKNKEVFLSNFGSGEHTISYPPIIVKVESISAIGATTVVKPQLNPVVLGSIDSVYLQDGGTGYGSTNIIDFHRRPNVGISTVIFNALLKPIIIGGRIVDVQILAKGKGFRKDSDIFVHGSSGDFAQINPIVADGGIVAVQILDGGVGYGDDTSLELRNRGTDAKFIADIHEWKINQVTKSSENINPEDGCILKPNTNDSLGLQAVSMYPPRKLRYQLGDNIDVSNLELSQNAIHSPILGWAYDGNPIYGPYGYETETGGSVVRQNSGYILNNQNLDGIRPPAYSLGYFTNDYLFNNSGSLDKHGGRYCVTPQFPDGTYAYFFSIDVDSSGVAEPKFPYLIGDRFKDLPVQDNFNTFFNQDIDLSKENLSRNIGPYYLSFGNSKYDLIDKVDDSYQQKFFVTKVKTSGIGSVSIFSRGSDYKVNDLLSVNNEGTDGSGASVVVDTILGKDINEISVGVSTFKNTELRINGRSVVGVTTVPHDFLDNEVVHISGITTAKFAPFFGKQKITVPKRRVGLAEYLPDIGATGITTFISVTDTVGFKPGDHIGVGTEVMVITEIDDKFKRFRVNRQNYIGIAITHPVSPNSVFLKPVEFEFSAATVDNQFFTYAVQPNRSLYFSPEDTVGVGSTGRIYDIINTGIGTALTESYDTRFVPEKRIFVPNHRLATGQPLRYNVGTSGTSIVVANTAIGSTSGIGTVKLEDNSIVYAVNFGQNYLGISTIGFTTIGDALYFFDVADNVGYAHSFTTQFPRVNANVERYFTSVVTQVDHGLQTGDIVKFNTTPTQTENIKLRFDPLISKITSDRVSFSSTSISADYTAIDINDETFQSGDKVVFYASEGNLIGGLENNKTYFVLREDPQFIKLVQYKSDIADSNPIVFSSVDIGTYEIAKVNPALYFTKGNKFIFDISDVSLKDMRLEFYSDGNYRKNLEVAGTDENGFAITRNGISGTTDSTVTITSKNNYPTKSFYNLVPVVPSDQRKLSVVSDKDVIGNNSITLNDMVVNGDQLITVSDSKTFTYNLDRRPSETQTYVSRLGVSTIFYETSSTSAIGPVYSTKTNFSGRGYRIIPSTNGFVSSSGKNATVKILSENIGKIDTLERVKDGFDYPTDPTLIPFLSVPAVVDVAGIQRINTIDILDGGRNYSQPPNLIIRGNDKIDLQSRLSGGAVDKVFILQNAFEFDEPLSIIPTQNSNGYDIDQITHVGNTVTLELLLDAQFNKPIRAGYATTNVEFPFKVGDSIFVEGCRLKADSVADGEINFNSENFDYKFFTVTGINTANFTLSYSVAGINTGTLGSYDDDFGLGYVVNYNDMAKFRMTLINDAKFLSEEKVTSKKFEGFVSPGGWDPRLSQLRLSDTSGVLSVGDEIYGEQSTIIGRVESVNRFNIRSTLGVSRDKVAKNDNTTGILNEFSQRISDNFYYQKFSYSIKGRVPYDTWRESVRSIVHPSGFREFCDLEIISKPTKNMKVKSATNSVNLLVNIDNDIYLQERQNFALVTEDDMAPDGSIQRIFFPEGRPIKSYILNKTNKVLLMDDISSGFNGDHDRTGTLVGNVGFKLKSKGQPLFKATVDASDSSVIDLVDNIITIPNHNFQTGQELNYSLQGGSPIGIATTSHISGLKDIVMSVESALAGSGAMFENGYNVEIPELTVTGLGTVVSPIVTFVVYGFGSPDGGLPGISTRGTGARFQVKFTYDQSTGQPLSTNVTLTQGGTGYYVGDNVSIAGTYLGGSTPANDLTFPVSRITGTRTGVTTTYLNVPSTSDLSGTGARFDVTRDSNLDIENIVVVSGGSGYVSTETISIAGTYIGGSGSGDDLLCTPVELGGTAIPEKVFVQKIDDVTFKISGLSTSLPLNFVGYGTGTHKFSVADPSSDALILIDNVIQSPLRNKKLEVGIGSPIGIYDQSIVVTTGITSLAPNDVIKYGDEFMKVKQIGDGTFVQGRRAEIENTVDNNFYYDVNRMNSTITRFNETVTTHDDRPPY
jgi:hypothetical protein